jgi:hypothetical protein
VSYLENATCVCWNLLDLCMHARQGGSCWSTCARPTTRSPPGFLAYVQVSDAVVARVGNVSRTYGEAFGVEAWARDLFAEEVGAMR